MSHRWKLLLASLAAAAMLGAAPSLALEPTIKGTGAVTGTVTAQKPFKAAQIYLRGQDKPVTFMVFSAGGKYQAINVLPGTYEVSVGRRGFSSEPQKIV